NREKHELKKIRLEGVHANLPKLPSTMGLEENCPKDVHFGYGHDLPTLRKKAISYYRIKKKSRPLKFSNTVSDAFW
ncbi:hypothetical protein SB822_61410, partial [Paraburkholderia sp. SIMBA_054]